MYYWFDPPRFYVKYYHIQEAKSLKTEIHQVLKHPVGKTRVGDRKKSRMIKIKESRGKEEKSQ